MAARPTPTVARQAMRNATPRKPCVAMSARTLDVRKERLPARGGLQGRANLATEYERVALTFVCERGQP